MSVQPIASLGGSYSDRHLAAQQAVQGAFSQLLTAAGKQGYASAKTPPAAATGESPPAAVGESPAAALQSWQDWLDVVGSARYQSQGRSAQTLSTYNQLLLKAQTQNAYAAPQAFLQQLSASELATLQHVNNLAQPINVSGLTEEGALNLLLPPPAQVDADGDGLTQTGAGYTIRFPDSRTPREVVDAWNQATKDLPPREKMLRQLQMKQDTLLANIRVDSAGRVTRIDPGQPGFTNPEASPGYSYLNLAERMLASLDYFKQQIPPDQYTADQNFWSKLQAALQMHRAN